MANKISLDSSPSKDEGYIAEVEMEYARTTASDERVGFCTDCGGEIQVNQPHVRATVWLYTDTRRGERMSCPSFCDRDCWRGWASAE